MKIKRILIITISLFIIISSFLKPIKLLAEQTSLADYYIYNLDEIEIKEIIYERYIYDREIEEILRIIEEASPSPELVGPRVAPIAIPFLKPIATWIAKYFAKYNIATYTNAIVGTGIGAAGGAAAINLYESWALDRNRLYRDIDIWLFGRTHSQIAYLAYLHGIAEAQNGHLQLSANDLQRIGINEVIPFVNPAFSIVTEHLPTTVTFGEEAIASLISRYSNLTETQIINGNARPTIPGSSSSVSSGVSTSTNFRISLGARISPAGSLPQAGLTAVSNTFHPLVSVNFHRISLGSYIGTSFSPVDVVTSIGIPTTNAGSGIVIRNALADPFTATTLFPEGIFTQNLPLSLPNTLPVPELAIDPAVLSELNLSISELRSLVNYVTTSSNVRFAALEGDIASQNQRTNEAFAAINALNTQVNGGFEALNGRVGALELGLSGANTGIQGLNNRVGSLELGIGNVNTGIQGLNNRIGDIELGIGNVNTGIQAIGNDIAVVNTGIQGINERIGSLEGSFNSVISSITSLGSSIIGDFSYIDFSVFTVPYDRFPFSIPWDLMELFRALESYYEAPRFYIDFSDTFMNQVFVLDLSEDRFLTIVITVRFLLLILFTMSLMSITINMLK